MSILETFYVLFKSDASDLKKGADEAEKTTKRLNETLKGTLAESGKIGASFLDIASGFLKIGSAAIAAHAIFEGLRGAEEYANNLTQTAYLLGVNVEQLGAWDDAIVQAGGTAQGFQQSLRSFAEHFNTTPQTALRSLLPLADTFARLNRFQAFRLGKSIGLDEPTILLLQQGRREVESTLKQMKELGELTQKNSEVFNEYRKETNNLDHAFRTLFTVLDIALVPVLTKFKAVLIPVVQYLTAHKDLVVGALLGISAAAAVLFGVFLWGNPLLVVALGAIALIGIAYEDIKAFANGQPSLTGKFVHFWKDALNSINDEFKKIFGVSIVEIVENSINKIKEIIKKGIKFFGTEDTSLGGILEGQKTINLATGLPINSQTTNSAFSSQAFARNSVVNTGPITVQTQATDAVGVADGLTRELNLSWQRIEYAQAANFFSNGVMK